MEASVATHGHTQDFLENAKANNQIKYSDTFSTFSAQFSHLRINIIFKNKPNYINLYNDKIKNKTMPGIKCSREMSYYY